MKLFIPYSDIVNFVKKKAGVDIAIRFVEAQTVSVSCRPNDFIGDIVVNAKVNAVTVSTFNIELSSKTPGVEQIICGAVEFLGSRVSALKFLKVEGKSVEVALKQITQLADVVGMVRALLFETQADGFMFEITL